MHPLLHKVFYALVFCLFFAFPSGVVAATLSVSPSNTTLEVGERLVVRVMVTSDKALNAAAGKLVFTSDVLAVESVTKGPVLNFWVTEPSFSNAAGTVQFEGVSLSGFSEGSGTLVTVTLRARKEGVASLRFETGQVLANDGQGTDITSGFSNGSYTVVAATKSVDDSVPAEVLPPEVPIPDQPTPTEPQIAEPQPAVDSVMALVTKYLSLIALVVFFIIGVVASAAYSWYHFVRLRHTVRHELKEAQDIVAKSFRIFEKDIAARIDELQEVRKTRAYTGEEVEFLEQLSKDLDDARRIIAKEMRDVDPDQKS